MLKSLLPLMALLLALQSTAQLTPPTLPPTALSGQTALPETDRAFRAIRAADRVHRQEKVTGTGMRLIALAMGSFAQDTVTFHYSGTRTSSYDFRDLVYRLPMDEPFNDAGDVLFDTVRQYDVLMSSHKPVYVRFYDAAGRVIREDRPLSTGDTLRTRVTYNAQGLPVTWIKSKYSIVPSTWDEIDLHFYTWNAAGQLLRDSNTYLLFTTWITRYHDYTYDAAGYPTKITSWALGGLKVEETDITYNNAHQPVRLFTQALLGIGYSDHMRDSIAYTGGVQTYRRLEMWNIDSNSFQPYLEEFRHLNSAALPDSLWGTRYNGLGGPSPFSATLKYNAAGLPTRQTRTGGWAPDLNARYYYETFDLGVTDATPRMSVRVYPNPVSTVLHISTPGKMQERLQCKVTDVSGRVLRSVWSNPSAEVRMDVADLPAGLYFLSVCNASGESSVVRFVKE